MIYITMSMYWEAKPFISYLGLKKYTNITKFQVFKNEEIILIITGVGIMSSAIATTYLLTKFNSRKSDLFINIGICGSKNKDLKIGTPVLCHKIINHNTKKSFYPDMIYLHPFKEGVLETFPGIIGEEEVPQIKGDLVDMEGAGAYEAATTFLSSDNINCIKIVSDFLQGEKVTIDKVVEIIENNVSLIVSWIEERKKMCISQPEIFTKEEDVELQKITKNINLTTAMNYKLIELAKHYKIRCGELLSIMKPFLEVNCKSKREGKKYFEELTKRFMEF